MIEILSHAIRSRDDKRHLRFEAYDLVREYCEENLLECQIGDSSDEEPFEGAIYYSTNFARCNFNADDDIKKHTLKVSGIISRHIHE